MQRGASNELDEEGIKVLKERAHDLLFVAHYQGQRHPSWEEKEEVQGIVEKLAGAAGKGLLADELASALRELHQAGGAVKSLYARPFTVPSHTEAWVAAMRRAKTVMEVHGLAVDRQPELERDGSAPEID